MRITLLSIFFFSFSVLTNASIIQVSGEVFGTWDVDTVQVMDDLLVPNNLTLTINPGVTVIFEGHYIFEVAGQVLAEGNITNQVLFTVSDTTGFYNLEINDGGWNGFWFNHLGPNNDSTIFEYCHFEFGKAVGTDTTYWHGGALCIREYDKLRLSNCTFSNNSAYVNGGAVYCKEANIQIEHCNFIANAGGTEIDWGYGGAVCFEYSDAKVYRNYFTQNSSTGVGGGLSFEYSKVDLESNIFHDNYSAIGGGVCFLRSEAGNYSVVNNLVTENEATFFGGGVAFLEADVLFINNTVAENIAPYGGGMYFNAEAMPTLKNCIIWNNTSIANDGWQVYIWDLYSTPGFYYCDIQDGLDGFSGSGGTTFSGVYENNIDQDPQFTEAGIHPFMLTEDSPCKNSATPDTTGLLLPEFDLGGNFRFQDGIVDMGAYEVQETVGLFHAKQNNQIFNISPNPIEGFAEISFSLDNPTNVCFSLLDINGSELLILKESQFHTGIHNLTIDFSNINKGAYFIKASFNHKGISPSIKKIIIK